MQDDRQVKLAGDFQLLGKVERLALPVRILDEMIEADFADRDRVAHLQPDPQSLQIPALGMGDEQRMYAKGKTTTRVTIRHTCRVRKSRGLDCGDENPADTCFKSTFNDLVAILIELEGVEMTVGVDEHRAVRICLARPSCVSVLSIQACVWR